MCVCRCVRLRLCARTYTRGKHTPTRAPSSRTVGRISCFLNPSFFSLLFSKNRLTPADLKVLPPPHPSAPALPHRTPPLPHPPARLSFVESKLAFLQRRIPFGAGESLPLLLKSKQNGEGRGGENVGGRQTSALLNEREHHWSRRRGLSDVRRKGEERKEKHQSCHKM